MNRIKTIILGLIIPFGLSAQNIESVLSEIENNNTALRAYKDLNEAQKLENKTGIYPENPELGFNYLWGNPSTIGERKDFSVTQSFDFPTAYGIKRKIAEAKNQQSDLEYELQRKTILYRAKMLCNELIYLNAIQLVLEERAGFAREIAEAYNRKFEIGEINILDKNKAHFNLLNAEKELETNHTEREIRMSELTALNGGNPLTFKQKSFENVSLPRDFSSWYAEYELKNIELQQATNSVAISGKEIQLSKALGLPKFSGGYMSESVVGESFRGISVGMSIPLWENKNRVKLATAQQKVHMERVNDHKIQTYNQLKGQYEKAVNLQNTIKSYKEALETVNSSALLKKALDAGEISLIEYILELTMYYETYDKLIMIEKELNQLAAGLYFFNL